MGILPLTVRAFNSGFTELSSLVYLFRDLYDYCRYYHGGAGIVALNKAATVAHAGFAPCIIKEFTAEQRFPCSGAVGYREAAAVH